MTNALITLSFILLSPAGTSTPARYAVMVDAPQAINAIEARVVLPPGVQAKDLVSSGSVVSYWIQAPEQKDDAVSFAGVIPQGFSGRGELVEFSLPQGTQGELKFSDTRAYWSGPDAREAPIRALSLSLSTQARPGALLTYILGVIALIVLGWFMYRHVRLRFL